MTNMTNTTEAQAEHIIDKRVMARLATDRAYNNAESSEEQAEREAEIERQEVERFYTGRVAWTHR